MPRFDHRRIPVTDLARSRTWCMASGIKFAHEPRKSYRGYGAELKDPDGYFVRLWDKRSMKEK